MTSSLVGSYDSAANDASTFTLSPNDAALYHIVLTATFGDGAQAVASEDVTATIVPPTVTAITGGASGGTAGTPLTLTATVVSPASAVQAAGFTAVWTVTRSRDGGKTFQSYASSSSTTLVENPTCQLNPDDSGIYDVTLVATDKDGAASPAVYDQHHGHRPAPVVTISGPATAAQAVPSS